MKFGNIVSRRAIFAWALLLGLFSTSASRPADAAELRALRPGHDPGATYFFFERSGSVNDFTEPVDICPTTTVTWDRSTAATITMYAVVPNNASLASIEAAPALRVFTTDVAVPEVVTGAPNQIRFVVDAKETSATASVLRVFCDRSASAVGGSVTGLTNPLVANLLGAGFNINDVGTVDGRNLETDGAKIDGVAVGADNVFVDGAECTSGNFEMQSGAGIELFQIGGPDAISVNLGYAATLATGAGLGVERCVFTTDGTGSGGFICEGTASNANEQLYLFPASDAADTINWITTGPASVTWVGPTAPRTVTIRDANVTLTEKVSSGTAALGTTSIASGGCASIGAATATNALATDVLSWSFNSDVSGITGFNPVTTGALSIYSYPGANTANFKVCNPTAAAIVPGAVSLNWNVVR
jgi:hypothetical protein